MCFGQLLYIASSKVVVSSDYLPKADNDQLQIIINIVLSVVGAIAVFVVVYAGIQMVISAGNTEKVATARKSLLAAIAGLLIIFSAQVIVNYIWDKV